VSAAGGPPAESILHGLPPILDSGVRMLILGSFPSPASLAAQRYYGHRQNQFWRLLGALFDEPLGELDYPDRQRCLLRHRVGVWDVYRCCRRQGALDSAIRSPESNAWLASVSRGVARDSQHINGNAMDIRFPGVPVFRIRQAARSLNMGGVGFYPRSGFVHLDTGPVRYW